MWGTSWPDDKLTADLGNVIEAAESGDRQLIRITAGKLLPDNFRLLQHNRHRKDLAVTITDLLLIGAKLTSAYRRGTMKSLRNGALQCRYSEARSRVTTSIG